MILIDYKDIITVKWGAVRSLLTAVDTINMSLSMSVKQPYKLGLDFHGVIDSSPNAFSKVTGALISAGHEVHILTGHLMTDVFIQKLNDFNVHWTSLFSIAEYHKENKTQMWYTGSDNPWMDTEIWNRSKAEYCERHSINLMIDDSDVYGQYFKTPYFKYTTK